MRGPTGRPSFRVRDRAISRNTEDFMRFRHALGAALVMGTTVLLGACTEDSTPFEPHAAAFSKGGKPGGGGDGLLSSECGGKTNLLDSRVSLTWSGAITGDGRGNTFVGGQDGVHGKIFYHDQSCSVSGDIVFDADMNAKRIKRHLTIAFPAGNDLGLGTVTTAPFVNFASAMQLGSDAGQPHSDDGRDAKMEAKDPLRPRNVEYPSLTATYPGYELRNDPDRPLRLASTGIAGCDPLIFSMVEITREAGRFDHVAGTAADGKSLGAWSHEVEGAWTIRTVANDDGVHEARCYTTSGNTESPNGAPMHIPFTVTVVEIR
jgi:hypothetical protein